MTEDPDSLGGMVEGGIKKVAPLFATGAVLIVFVLWAWPDPTTTSKDYAPTDVRLAVVTDLPDGGKETSSEIMVHAGDLVRLSANVPFVGTVKVYRLGGEDGDRLWPVAHDAAERTSAGKVVELGEVAVVGDAGVQTWLMSLCPLGAAAQACVVREQQPLCPDGCLTTTMRAQIVP
jgi:hypothetical protein